MKKIHLITACLLCCGITAAFTACTSQSSSSYTITGTAEGTQDGDTVFLCDMSYGVVQPQDTAYVKNGKFEFKGEAEEASFRVLLAIHNGRSVASAVFVLENADIRATLSADDSSEQGTIEGGPNNKLLKEYLDGLKTTTDAMEVTEYDRKFIIDHVPSAFSDILFGMRMQNFTEEQQEEILKLFGEKQPQYSVYKAIMAEREASKSSAIGAQYTDIELPSPDGTLIRVSDFVAKNKYTLVDFWASWCGPCRAEMPTVVKAYTDYHTKGLEVVGVSLDDDHNAWVKAINQLRMPWPQMSDLKGWDCAGAKKYNIRSIPANVLIDQQGKIIAKDLRGNELLEKMAELMK